MEIIIFNITLNRRFAQASFITLPYMLTENNRKSHDYRRKHSKLTKLIGCACVLASNIDTCAALPVLSPISLSQQKVNLIQTQAQAEGAQTIQSHASDVPVAVAPPEPVDPCQAQLGGLFTKERLSEDPANTVVDFVDEYCLEAAGFLNSKYFFVFSLVMHITSWPSAIYKK